MDRRSLKPSRDISGLKFNRLLAVKYVKKVSGRQYWLFLCDCGNYKEMVKSKVVGGYTKSCGCLQREVAKIDSTTHGLCGHPLWNKWRDMYNRCYTPSVKHFNIYGGRGVTMCEEWKNDFMSFYNWATTNGWRPGLQIDKDIKAMELGVEPNLYSPERCQFVTPKENSNHRRNNRYIEYNGTVKTLMQLSEEFKIHNGTLLSRIRRGWPITEALSISTNKTGKTKYTL